MRKHSAVMVCVLLMLCLLTGCGGASQSYRDYVDAVLLCTYQGETGDYQKLTGTDEVAAQAVHEAEITHVADLLCYQATVDPEHITPDTRTGFEGLAKTLMGRFRYETMQANYDGSAYRVTVSAAPTDFWTKALPALERVYKQDFAERFYNAPADSQELFNLEAEWGERVLTVLTPYIEEISYGEAQTVTVYVRVDENGRYNISAEDWEQVDRVLLGLETE